MYAPYYLTGTADVGAANGGTLHGVILTAASATSTIVIRQNGSGGSIIAAFSVVANTSVAVSNLCAVYSGQLHATLTGSGVQATVIA